MYREAIKSEAEHAFEKLGDFSPDFYLAGGTALALQIGHRISVDFDLFSSFKLPENLFDTLESTYTQSVVEPVVNEKNQVTVLVDGIQLTFLHYPFLPVLPFVEYMPINLLAGKEIAAAKAYSLGRRATFKDYVDLYFVIADGISTLQDIILLSEKKYGNLFNRKLFLEQLVYLKDVEELEIEFLKSKVEKDQIEFFFKDQVKEIKVESW